MISLKKVRQQNAKHRKPSLAKFIMDDSGNFWIEVDGVRSDRMPYDSIAVVVVNDRTYIGVTLYYDGDHDIFKPETVMEVSAIPSEFVHHELTFPMSRSNDPEAKDVATNKR